MFPRSGPALVAGAVVWPPEPAGLSPGLAGGCAVFVCVVLVWVVLVWVVFDVCAGVVRVCAGPWARAAQAAAAASRTMTLVERRKRLISRVLQPRRRRYGRGPPRRR